MRRPSSTLVFARVWSQKIRESSSMPFSIPHRGTGSIGRRLVQGGTAGKTVLDSVLDPAEVKVLSTRCGFVFCNLQIPRPSILFESNRRHQIISPALALRCKYPPRRGAFSYEHITIERGISVQWGRGAARPSKFARTSDGGNCDLPRLRDKNCLCNS